MKFSIEDFFSKCDRIRSFLRIWLHLLKESLMENFIFCSVKEIIYTLKNTVISPNFLVWRFCRKEQFPHSFGRLARDYGETVPFHKISTLGNQVKLRYFLQCYLLPITRAFSLKIRIIIVFCKGFALHFCVCAIAKYSL